MGLCCWPAGASGFKSEYELKVMKIIDIMNKTGANLLKRDRITGYGIVMDKEYKNALDYHENNLNYPIANSFFKINGLTSNQFIVLSARLNEMLKHSFELSYQLLPNLPNLDDYKVQEFPKTRVYYLEKKYDLEYILDELIDKKKNK